MSNNSSNYTLKKKYLRFIALLVDRIGSYLFRYKKHPTLPDGTVILVIRLDQIGDIVLAEPFLRELKFYRPEVRIKLITSKAGEKLFKSLPGIDKTISLDVGWFMNKKFFLRPVWDWLCLWWKIRTQSADAIVDLRGDFRHILAARLAKPRTFIISYGITGGGFLLNRELDYKAEETALERNMMFLKDLGVKKQWKEIILSPFISTMPLQKRVKSYLPKKDKKWIVLHAGAGTSAKTWPIAGWRLLAHSLKELDAEFFWIGDNAAKRKSRQIMELIGSESRNRFHNLCEIVTLYELGSFLKMSDLLISADSGPVHIAASQSLPVIVLSSGTNLPEEWMPPGKNVNIIRYEVDCSPCHEKKCPKERHYCMEGIKPQDVYNEVLRVLDKVKS